MDGLGQLIHVGDAVASELVVDLLSPDLLKLGSKNMFRISV